MSTQDMKENTSKSAGDHGDTTDLDLLAGLDEETFGARVPAILSSASQAIFKSHQRKPSGIEAIRSRATEAPTVAAVSDTIKSPINDQDGFYLAWTALNEVVVDLPLKDLHHYRPALKAVSETIASDTTASHLGSATGLRSEAASLIRFMDDPTAVWVPQTKGDHIAERSLQERVRTADEMRPHVPGLLDWLADANWPPFRGCRAQLARFPEVTVGPIGQLIEKERGDGGWIASLLDFVDECVPLSMWEELKPTVKALVEEAKGDEDDWEVSDLARQWLEKLEKA
ncbi:hypothetical protein LCI18_000151 [Fusarium solani-melongenae]|uniref:Uncharacterized protein n=1 Tax=Fusarium solani subsp. cucurbitae TaxID=2747967 RepID=A0ACD3YJZ9_FUSSC|nr:hypothetical protein LCI18_000151 [Fusarium solani-melongenae]